MLYEIHFPPLPQLTNSPMHLETAQTMTSNVAKGMLLCL